MYRSFAIRNFRGFDQVELYKLGRINLIAGKNNVGKTSILDALLLHSGEYDTETVLRLQIIENQRVRIQSPRRTVLPFNSLFKDFDSSNRIQLVGEIDEFGRRVLDIEIVDPRNGSEDLLRRIRNIELRARPRADESLRDISVLMLTYTGAGQSDQKYYLIHDGIRVYEDSVPDQRYSALYLPSHSSFASEINAERYSNLEFSGQQEVVVNTLRVIEPRLQDLTVLALGGMPLLYANIGLKQPFPISIMGDGINRLTALTLAIGNVPNGLMLVDEVENGIHYSILKDVWKVIAQAAKAFNTQIFATTHSRECIVAAHQAFLELNSYDFRLHRLESDREGHIRSVTYDQDTLEAAIDLDLEVR